MEPGGSPAFCVFGVTKLAIAASDSCLPLAPGASCSRGSPPPANRVMQTGRTARGGMAELTNSGISARVTAHCALKATGRGLPGSRSMSAVS